MPFELDANAAAAAFLRAHHSASLTEVLNGEEAALARSNTPPEAIADLPAKIVAFMFLFREIAEDPSVFPGIPFEQRLSQISPAGAAVWRTLSAP